MAGRKIEIPFGPDKTGRMESLPEIAPSVAPDAIPEVFDQPAPQPALKADDLPGFDLAPQASVPEASPADQQASPSAKPEAMPAPQPEPQPQFQPEPEFEIEQPVAFAGEQAAPEFDYAQAQTAPAELDEEFFGTAQRAAEAEPAPFGAEAPAYDAPAADEPFASETPEADTGAPIIAPSFGSSRSESADEDDLEDEENDDRAGQALAGVQSSFMALRDSIGQGRELKARERERDELEERLIADREELADRDDILANYAALVAEQDAIISQNTQQRDTCKAELSQVVAKHEETTEALGRMRDYHDTQLQPLKAALGRARATADQAKNDERSRKSEMNATESEARRSAEGDDSAMTKAQLEQVKIAYDEAVARSNAAKEALADAQRAYDDLNEQVKQAEAPLESSIADLEKREDQLKADIAQLGDVISTATKRRQYCDSVYQYPEETEKLRRSIASDEGLALRMDEEADELRELLAQSKAKSTKAKVAIAGVIVVIILIILLVWFLSSR